MSYTSGVSRELMALADPLLLLALRKGIGEQTATKTLGVYKAFNMSISNSQSSA